MLEKVRVGMIGAGSMANRVHYPSLASFADVEIAAICDLDETRLTATADKYAVQKRYTDYRKMAEEVVPDAVYAIGPPHLLYDVWQWCLTHGLNLCIEKPLGITLHQARALAYLAEAHGCITQVSFQRRSSPLLAHLRAKCLQKGAIVHAQSTFYKYEIEPYLHARDRMLDDGVHSIDTLRWLCGGEVVGVQSLTKRVQVPDLNFLSALLEFDNGSTGILINSWSSGRRIFKIEAHAPGICVEANPEGKGHLFADGDTVGVEYDTRQVAGSDEFYIYGGFQAKNREFIDGVKSHTLPPSHFGDALKTMEVAETILAQTLLAGR
ncbi:MAG: Gfo/Idh/MocA family oxidoreductase [Caldilineaceae bacterium]|nr:Gfo/Idh/MocA family oxidoreductase [Caldilineaceae bacterium]HRJ43161.1 Gfo/Idh/MocA family oxidoreductase [Caldilineaceae bacterium]